MSTRKKRMKKNNFAILICTHGRPNAQHTFHNIRKCGYEGRVVFIVDDEDNTVDELRQNMSDEPNTEVVQFCKQEYIDKSDRGTIENQIGRAHV